METSQEREDSGTSQAHSAMTYPEQKHPAQEPEQLPRHLQKHQRQGRLQHHQPEQATLEDDQRQDQQTSSQPSPSQPSPQQAKNTKQDQQTSSQPSQPSPQQAKNTKQDQQTSSQPSPSQPSPGQAKNPTKQLTQGEREYWQQRLPRGFQFYLERLARGVIRNQPANILQFSAVYLEELLVSRNAELWKLPVEPYFHQLFSRKTGLAPWQARRRHLSPEREERFLVLNETLPDVVATEHLPDSSLSDEGNLESRCWDDRDLNLPKDQEAMIDSPEMFTASDCLCHPKESDVLENHSSLDAPHHTTAPSAAFDATSFGSTTSLDVTEDAQTSAAVTNNNSRDFVVMTCLAQCQALTKPGDVPPLNPSPHQDEQIYEDGIRKTWVRNQLTDLGLENDFQEHQSMEEKLGLIREKLMRSSYRRSRTFDHTQWVEVAEAEKERREETLLGSHLIRDDFDVKLAQSVVTEESNRDGANLSQLDRETENWSMVAEGITDSFRETEHLLDSTKGSLQQETFNSVYVIDSAGGHSQGLPGPAVTWEQPGSYKNDDTDCELANLEHTMFTEGAEDNGGHDMFINANDIMNDIDNETKCLLGNEVKGCYLVKDDNPSGNSDLACLDQANDPDVLNSKLCCTSTSRCNSQVNGSPHLPHSPNRKVALFVASACSSVPLHKKRDALEIKQRAQRRCRSQGQSVQERAADVRDSQLLDRQLLRGSPTAEVATGQDVMATTVSAFNKVYPTHAGLECPEARAMRGALDGGPYVIKSSNEIGNNGAVEVPTPKFDFEEAVAPERPDSSTNERILMRFSPIDPANTHHHEVYLESRDSGMSDSEVYMKSEEIQCDLDDLGTTKEDESLDQKVDMGGLKSGHIGQTKVPILCLGDMAPNEELMLNMKADLAGNVPLEASFDYGSDSVLHQSLLCHLAVGITMIPESLGTGSKLIGQRCDTGDKAETDNIANVSHSLDDSALDRPVSTRGWRHLTSATLDSQFPALTVDQNVPVYGDSEKGADRTSLKPSKLHSEDGTVDVLTDKLKNGPQWLMRSSTKIGPTVGMHVSDRSVHSDASNEDDDSDTCGPISEIKNEERPARGDRCWRKFNHGEHHMGISRQSLNKQSSQDLAETRVQESVLEFGCENRVQEGVLEFGYENRVQEGVLKFGCENRVQEGVLEFGYENRVQEGVLEFGYENKVQESVLEFGCENRVQEGVLEFGYENKVQESVLEFGCENRVQEGVLEFGYENKVQEGVLEFGYENKVQESVLEFGCENRVQEGVLEFGYAPTLNLSEVKVTGDMYGLLLCQRTGIAGLDLCHDNVQDPEKSESGCPAPSGEYAGAVPDDNVDHICVHENIVGLSSEQNTTITNNVNVGGNKANNDYQAEQPHNYEHRYDETFKLFDKQDVYVVDTIDSQTNLSVRLDGMNYEYKPETIQMDVNQGANEGWDVCNIDANLWQTRELQNIDQVVISDKEHTVDLLGTTLLQPDGNVAQDHTPVCAHVEGTSKLRMERALALAKSYVSELENVTNEIESFLPLHPVETTEAQVRADVEDGPKLVGSFAPDVSVDAELNIGQIILASITVDEISYLDSPSRGLNLSQSILDQLSHRVVDILEGRADVGSFQCDSQKGPVQYRIGNVVFRIIPVLDDKADSSTPGVGEGVTSLSESCASNIAVKQRSSVGEVHISQSNGMDPEFIYEETKGMFKPVAVDTEHRNHNNAINVSDTSQNNNNNYISQTSIINNLCQSNNINYNANINNNIPDGRNNNSFPDPNTNNNIPDGRNNNSFPDPNTNNNIPDGRNNNSFPDPNTNNNNIIPDNNNSFPDLNTNNNIIHDNNNNMSNNNSCCYECSETHIGWSSHTRQLNAVVCLETRGGHQANPPRRVSQQTPPSTLPATTASSENTNNNGNVGTFPRRRSTTCGLSSGSPIAAAEDGVVRMRSNEAEAARNAGLVMGDNGEVTTGVKSQGQVKAMGRAQVEVAGMAQTDERQGRAYQADVGVPSADNNDTPDAAAAQPRRSKIFCSRLDPCIAGEKLCRRRQGQHNALSTQAHDDHAGPRRTSPPDKVAGSGDQAQSEPASEPDNDTDRLIRVQQRCMSSQNENPEESGQVSAGVDDSRGGNKNKRCNMCDLQRKKRAKIEQQVNEKKERQCEKKEQQNGQKGQPREKKGQLNGQKEQQNEQTEQPCEQKGQQNGQKGQPCEQKGQQNGQKEQQNGQKGQPCEQKGQQNGQKGQPREKKGQLNGQKGQQNGQKEQQNEQTEQPCEQKGQHNGQKGQLCEQKGQQNGQKEQQNGQKGQPCEQKGQQNGQKEQQNGQKGQACEQKGQQNGQKEQHNGQKGQPCEQKRQQNGQKEQQDGQKGQPCEQKGQKNGQKEQQKGQKGQPCEKKGQQNVQKGQQIWQKGKQNGQKGQPCENKGRQNGQKGQHNEQKGQPCEKKGQQNEQKGLQNEQKGQDNEHKGQPCEKKGQKNGQKRQPNEQKGQPCEKKGQQNGQKGQQKEQKTEQSDKEERQSEERTEQCEEKPQQCEEKKQNVELKELECEKTEKSIEEKCQQNEEKCLQDKKGENTNEKKDGRYKCSKKNLVESTKDNKKDEGDTQAVIVNKKDEGDTQAVIVNDQTLQRLSTFGFKSIRRIVEYMTGEPQRAVSKHSLQEKRSELQSPKNGRTNSAKVITLTLKPNQQFKRIVYPKKADFPMRVRATSEDNNLEYVPTITRRLTVESPEENFLIHTTHIRPNPKQQEPMREFEVSSQRKRFYPVEEDGVAYMFPTKRLICETECVSSKDPATKHLVLENGTSDAIHATVRVVAGNVRMKRRNTTGNYEELHTKKTEVTGLVSDIDRDYPSLVSGGNYFRLAGKYMVIGRPKPVGYVDKLIESQDPNDAIFDDTVNKSSNALHLVAVEGIKDMPDQYTVSVAEHLAVVEDINVMPDQYTVSVAEHLVAVEDIKDIPDQYTVSVVDHITDSADYCRVEKTQEDINEDQKNCLKNAKSQVNEHKDLSPMGNHVLASSHVGYFSDRLSSAASCNERVIPPPSLDAGCCVSRYDVRQMSQSTFFLMNCIDLRKFALGPTLTYQGHHFPDRVQFCLLFLPVDSDSSLTKSKHDTNNNNNNSNNNTQYISGHDNISSQADLTSHLKVTRSKPSSEQIQTKNNQVILFSLKECTFPEPRLLCWRQEERGNLQTQVEIWNMILTNESQAGVALDYMFRALSREYFKNITIRRGTVFLSGSCHCCSQEVRTPSTADIEIQAVADNICPSDKIQTSYPRDVTVPAHLELTVSPCQQIGAGRQRRLSGELELEVNAMDILSRKSETSPSLAKIGSYSQDLRTEPGNDGKLTGHVQKCLANCCLCLSDYVSGAWRRNIQTQVIVTEIQAVEMSQTGELMTLKGRFPPTEPTRSDITDISEVLSRDLSVADMTPEHRSVYTGIITACRDIVAYARTASDALKTLARHVSSATPRHVRYKCQEVTASMLSL